MVGGNGGNQFRQYAGQNERNTAGYNDVIGNQNQIGNGNLVVARAEGNAAGQNENQIRCYNCRRIGHYARNCIVRPRRRDAAYLQTQLLIAQKEEEGIQLQAEEYDLMAAAADLDEIEEVNANCILMANLQQASTSGHPQQALKNKGIVNSGCSRHMIGNKAYLADYQDIHDRGFVAFGSIQEKLLDESQVLLRLLKQSNMYSFDLQNVVPSGYLTCLFAKASIDESNLWHMRLGHVNFKTMNKLVKGNLVSGLPLKIFNNDHSCFACQKGKQHKATYKAKLENSISQPLQMLHMDLFGPTSVMSINHKKYCLVVTDDFSRFCWVFFLATKDETSKVLKPFITAIENQINKKVKVIRCDNGTEFKNRNLDEFCGLKGIKKEYINARTPQQNRVVERKNRTLIKAAKTMIIDSSLPITFWAEAVNTACYVLNRALMTKTQNKTPYELLNVKKPRLDFMRPFRCPVTILKTLDPLGKFKGKADEGFFVRKAMSDQHYIVLPLWSSISFTYKSSDDKPADYKPNDHTRSKTVEELVNKDDQAYKDELDRLMSQEKKLLMQWMPLEKILNKDAWIKEELLKLAALTILILLMEPKKISQALDDESWVEAMQEYFCIIHGFIVYQIDVKSTFLYGTIEEEAYVSQPLSFIDPRFPNKIYRVEKTLYGLHLAPRAWYETLFSFILQNGYRRGTIDKTLFIKKDKDDIMLVQMYVDDIIFGSTKKSLCNEFEALMHKRFQISSMRVLTFFLGLQVKQSEERIFISKDKYVAEILKKFYFSFVKTASTPIETQKPLVKDEVASDVDVYLYRSMIGTLMYLTASRPDIMFAVCACSRFWVTPKLTHLRDVKRIFRYLKGQPKLGLWYPKDSPFDLKAYSDSHYAGANLDRKSITRGCQFLGRRLISWQCKKQTIVATFTIEAEYVVVAHCCGHVLCIHD
nr:ribonuclease H-like domain-containing protein [Tanacetum cinerariifolium]